jgi:heme-degrading monooxygenase HmoA
MASLVLTVVTATVTEDRHDLLVGGFRELLNGPFPDGLLRTELLQGPDDRWRIQTLWRDRAALDAMRASSQPPAAPTLFRSVGSEPSLEIWDVVSDATARLPP